VLWLALVWRRLLKRLPSRPPPSMELLLLLGVLPLLLDALPLL
jgi:hypothetical protein